jgi:hypothetical protein
MRFFQTLRKGKIMNSSFVFFYVRWDGRAIHLRGNCSRRGIGEA